MIVRERAHGEFELVGPHAVAIALTREQVDCLNDVRAEAMPGVVESDPRLRPVARAFHYLLDQEASRTSALASLAESVSGRRVRPLTPAPAGRLA